MTGWSSGTVTFGDTAVPATDTVDTDGFKISDIGVITQTSNTQDANLVFTVTNVDADGETTAAQTLNMTIEGSYTFLGTTASESIQGSAGNDSMSGLGGNDILIGGSGNDILTGGTGSDTFKFSSLATNVVDTITDFTVDAIASQGDVLDVHDLLAGSSATLANVASGGFLFFTSITYDNSTHTATATLNVDYTGIANNVQLTPVATISLTNIPNLTGTAMDSTTLLNTLLGHTEIKI